jgi:hypothetical protein
VPPAVALLNYTSCGILLRIFSHNGIFAGFSIHISNVAVRISEAATDRGHSVLGEIGDGEIEEGVREETFHCLI